MGSQIFNLAYDALAAQNLSEHNVFTVEVFGGSSCNKELAAIGAGPCIRHREQEWAVVLQLEVLVFELLAIDGLSTGPVACREVSTLDHEAFDNTMEARTLVAQFVAGIAFSFLARAKSAEVLRRFGDNIVVLLLHVRDALIARSILKRLTSSKVIRPSRLPLMSTSKKTRLLPK